MSTMIGSQGSFFVRVRRPDEEALPQENVFFNASSYVETAPCTNQEVSVASLVAEFTSRPLQQVILPQAWAKNPSYLYRTTVEQMNKDQERLHQIVEEHNFTFQNKIQFVGQAEGGLLGFVEEVHLPPGTKMYVCADLHGQLLTLIGILSVLRAQRLLTDTYRCTPGFYMIFLGDYIDRGMNDLQLLALLLMFRIENPTSVFLIRGNHDRAEGDVHDGFANQTLIEYFKQNRRVWENCFQSFPFALCVSSVEASQQSPLSGQQQYVHFSHGFLGLSVDPVSRLQGRDCMSGVSDSCELTGSWLGEDKIRPHARDELYNKLRFQESALSPLGYIWSDINENIGSFGCNSQRGIGFCFTSRTVDLIRKATEVARAKICFFVRGHEHEFKEYQVVRRAESRKRPSKVIAMTLPMHAFVPNITKVVQGAFFRVAPRVRDWKKSFMISIWNPEIRGIELRVDPAENNMYDTLN